MFLHSGFRMNYYDENSYVCYLAYLHALAQIYVHREREGERERQSERERERDISAFRIIHKLGGRNKVEDRWRYINSYIHALYLQQVAPTRKE